MWGFVDLSGVLSWEVQQQSSLHLHSWLISHCPVEGLGYSTQSTLGWKQKNMGHAIILGFVVYFEGNTDTHFMNAVLIYELLTATAMQGFMSFIFHTQADTEIRGIPWQQKHHSDL